MIKVFIATGTERSGSFVINGNTAQIGRGLANEINLKQASVSRNHAKIYKHDEQYYIEDLRSKNGTWINGHAIESGQKVQVQEGIPIALGNVLVSVGKKCSQYGLANQHLISTPPPAEEGFKKSAFTDRRAKPKKELELIYEISVELMGSLDLTELCEKVLNSIFSCLKRIDSGFVFLVEPETGKLKKIGSRWRGEKRTAAPGYSRTVVRRVVKEGKAIMMPNTAMENKAAVSESMEKIGIKCVICVPLVSKLGTRGAIYLQSVNVVHGFRKNDLLFLTGLSTPMALAMENALLYSKSRQTEEKLQKASDNLEEQVMNRTAELKKAKDKLRQLSVTDGLSGLYNYRYLIYSIEREFKRAIRYNRTLALLLMDIDYFKNLNDTYGHLCGDYVIKTLARILKSNVRATDVVARYGGDELAVMLIETDTKSALDVTEKLKKAIESHIFQWQTKQLDVNLSIGLATAPAPGIQDVSDLIGAADRALYRAKKAGRNSIIVFCQEKETATADQKSVVSPTSKQ
jgi:diguanylate cyclase (GGDEF)-like protein